jgi:hypothetical protein
MGHKRNVGFQGEVANELAARKCFLQGCDSEGHPVLVVWAARHDMGNRNIDETKRFICYCLDNTVAASDLRTNPGGQIKCLFDLSGPSNINHNKNFATFPLHLDLGS